MSKFSNNANDVARAMTIPRRFSSKTAELKICSYESKFFLCNMAPIQDGVQ